MTERDLCPDALIPPNLSRRGLPYLTWVLTYQQLAIPLIMSSYLSNCVIQSFNINTVFVLLFCYLPVNFQ